MSMNICIEYVKYISFYGIVLSKIHNPFENKTGMNRLHINRLYSYFIKSLTSIARKQNKVVQWFVKQLFNLGHILLP